MSAAHCVFFFFFRTKDERASYRTEDRLLYRNYLHGSSRMRQRWWSSNLYRLGLMPITALLLHQSSGFPHDKTCSAKKKTCKLNLYALDIKYYQRSLWFGLGSTFCREFKQN